MPFDRSTALCWAGGALPFVAFAAAGPFLDPFAASMLALVFLFAFLGQAWNLIFGFAGQLSLGHALFAGIGGYAVFVALLRYGLSPWIGLPAGAALAAAAGALIGLLGFRFGLKGVHFALLTIALAEFTRVMFSNWPFVGAMSGIFLPALKPANQPLLSLRGDAHFFYAVTLLLAAFGAGLTTWIRSSYLGYVWRAMRSDEAVARALGVRVFRHKVAATALSAGMTGLGGGVFALMNGSIFPDSAMGLAFSIEIIVGPIVGGLGTALGPLAGALFVVPLTQLTARVGQGFGLYGLSTLSYGVMLIAVIWVLPDGIWPTLARVWQRVVRRANPPAVLVRPDTAN